MPISKITNRSSTTQEQKQSTEVETTTRPSMMTKTKSRISTQRIKTSLSRNVARKIKTTTRTTSTAKIKLLNESNTAEQRIHTSTTKQKIESTTLNQIRSKQNISTVEQQLLTTPVIVSTNIHVDAEKLTSSKDIQQSTDRNFVEETTFLSLKNLTSNTILSFEDNSSPMATKSIEQTTRTLHRFFTKEIIVSLDINSTKEMKNSSEETSLSIWRISTIVTKSIRNFTTATSLSTQVTSVIFSPNSTLNPAQTISATSLLFHIFFSLSIIMGCLTIGSVWKCSQINSQNQSDREDTMFATINTDKLSNVDKDSKSRASWSHGSTLLISPFVK